MGTIIQYNKPEIKECHRIKDLLNQGRSDEEIKNEILDIYGEWMVCCLGREELIGGDDKEFVLGLCGGIRKMHDSIPERKKSIERKIKVRKAWYKSVEKKKVSARLSGLEEETEEISADKDELMNEINDEIRFNKAFKAKCVEVSVNMIHYLNRFEFKDELSATECLPEYEDLLKEAPSNQKNV